jgi:alpha-galactosidase
MADLAAGIAKAGARPGVWVRPLIAARSQPQDWRLRHRASILDPTVPEVRQLVKADIARVRGWGFELIKHDYSTFDITGRWGRTMRGDVTNDGWSFSNSNRTTAEVILDFYRAIREAAGDAGIIGCNTMSHLSAGIFELNRIGDDTSGQQWSRTRQMGVNTLAFRACQQDTFYAADADCVGMTTAAAVPWAKNRQWMDLLARSGTPLFLSLNRTAVTKEIEQDVREALATAAAPQSAPEALDWMDTPAPRRWKLMGQVREYDWS